MNYPLPRGWNASRIERVLAHYESQSEDEAVAEDQAASQSAGSSFVEVPKSLIPVVRQLIRGRHGTSPVIEAVDLHEMRRIRIAQLAGLAARVCGPSWDKRGPRRHTTGTDPRKRLRQLLFSDELSRLERCILVLHYLEDLSLGAVATALEMSAARVAAIHRGTLRRLRELMGLPGMGRRLARVR
jgi:hypothetical protein